MELIKIGAFIAELRHENKLTQEELGEKLGVTNKTISRWGNGNYLPSVEMLQMLSNLFTVSINELISGERFNEDSYRQKAEDTIINILKSSTFSLKERSDFYKKKWLKDHKGLIILYIILFLIMYFTGILMSKTIISTLSVILALIAYLRTRNNMMSYIESHVYDKSEQ